jgi:glyoxylase-like metal-dependent hydrolase (beta-lactamase superfamily II)
VTRLIVTHCHTDHIGFAGWLTERLGVELWGPHGGKWDHARRRADRAGTFRDELVDFYRRIRFGDLEEPVKIRPADQAPQ